MAVSIVVGQLGKKKQDVIQAALKQVPGSVCLSLDGVMFEIACKKGLVDDQAGMAHLTYEDCRDIQSAAADYIASQAEKENVIVDAQCAIKTPRGYYPGLPLWILEKLMPRSIVLMDENEGAGKELNLAYMAAYSTLACAYVQVVDGQKAEEAARHIAATLKS